MKVLPEHSAGEVHEAGTESQSQKRKHQESHAAPGKNSQQEMSELHFGNRRREHEELKRSRRRQHGGKHQASERMLIERPVKLLEALGADAFTQQLLPAVVAGQVNDDAAQSRSRRYEHDAHQKA